MKQRYASTVLVLSVGLAFPTAWDSVSAQPNGNRNAAAPAASGPSLSGLWQGMKDKLSGNPSASNAASSAPGAAAAAAVSAASGPIKIKEFKSGSKLAANWNDTHCKTLVEPFGLSDSAVSLGILKGQQVAKDALGSLLGTPAPKGDSARAEIRSAARQLNWLPMPIEVMMGEKSHESQANLLREDRKGSKDAYARARRILDEVLASVKEPHPYKFHIYVTTATGGNAEAAPGGFIYVDRNLVEKPAEEPRARFAIAHEVSHVLQRHRTRETQMRLSDGVDSLDQLGKLIASANDKQGGLVKLALGTKRLFVQHSEEQELQADGCAVRLLDAMTADRSEMIRSVNAFVVSLPPPKPPQPQQKVTNEAIFTELTDGEFSRHPSTDKRVQNLSMVLVDLRNAR